MEILGQFSAEIDRRATSAIEAPGSKLSATISRFSCAVHNRRRRALLGPWD